MSEKKYKRPVLDIMTKINANRLDAAILVSWAREASFEEGAPISTREIIRRLVDAQLKHGYPKRKKKTKDEAFSDPQDQQ